MDQEQQLKLQSFVDGELSEAESREIAAWVARDAEANGLLNELRNTRRALKDAEPRLVLPESREFYWSKIRRQIDENRPAPASATSSGWAQVFRRLFIPAGAAAAIALAALLAAVQSGLLNIRSAQAEMTLADSGAFTYYDYANGTTLVWVSYPAER